MSEFKDQHAALRSGWCTVQAQERVVFGVPAARAVVEEAERYDARRVFVVSTRSLSERADGPLQRILTALGSRLAGMYGAVRSHSPREDVIAAAHAAREARADLLVAVGGGSVIDATKAVQLSLWLGLKTPEAMEPYRSDSPEGERRGIVLPPEPIRTVAVSTTLSAAEFTSQAGITDARSHSKQGFGHRLFAPRSVVLDPEATLATPAWLLFCTGVRAVDHAVETFCSPRANPATEPLSLQGLRLLHRALLRIRAEPRDLAARLEAQFGMWNAMAAAAAGVPTGASHGIGYVLGGTYGVAHGHTSCVMLSATLRWNAVTQGERQRALSEAMGAPERSAAELVAELVAALDQPASLRAVNIGREQLDAIAERAMHYAPVRANPRPIRGPADVREILELAW